MILCLLFMLVIASQAIGVQDYYQQLLDDCPCSNKKGCLPVQTQVQKQVFAFAPGSSDKSSWQKYDWQQVTTIAWNMDKQLLCYAHARNVKIVVLGHVPRTFSFCNTTQQHQWIETVYHDIITNYADGVNIDIEHALDGKYATCFTHLVRQLHHTLRHRPGTRHSQITLDVPWAPRGIDGRYYEWQSLLLYVDYFFVMAYDMASQLYRQCLATSNAPLALVQQGLREYIRLENISPQKLILGVAWYGYKYDCISLYDQYCKIQPIPFHNAPCSDAVGHQIDFADITKRSTIVHWDEITSTPFFNLPSSNSFQTTSQVWFENAISLCLKNDLVRSYNLGGIGMWHANALNYTNATLPPSEYLWNAFNFTYCKSILSELLQLQYKIL